MADNNNRYVQIYDQKNKVKNDLRDKYQNYEELLEYATKAAIELHITKCTYQEFINASFFREFAVAEGSKEGLEQLDERMKDNLIYQEFMHMQAHDTKMIRSFRAGGNRHKEDKYYKDYVTSDWEKDPQRWPNIAKAVDYYYYELVEKLKNAQSSRESYDCRTIKGWLKERAKIKGFSTK